MSRGRAALGSALFLLAAPGVVAGLIPYGLTDWESAEPPAPLIVLGVCFVFAGVAVLVRAFASFVLEGSGTPAPIAAPDRLVVGGLYRYVRNPMYVAILAIVGGQTLILGRAVLLAYAAFLWLAFASFVRVYEEPTLRERYGSDYDAYRRAVPGWIPRLRPWR